MNLLHDFGQVKIWNCIIDANSKLDLLRKEFAGKIEKEEVVNGWVSFFLGKTTVFNKDFSVRLSFSPKGKLAYIFLAYLFIDEQLEWEKWSAESEQKRNQQHMKILREFVGPSPYNFQWGEISSEISPQTGSASITIRYH